MDPSSGPGPPPGPADATFSGKHGNLSFFQINGLVSKNKRFGSIFKVRTRAVWNLLEDNIIRFYSTISGRFLEPRLGHCCESSFFLDRGMEKSEKKSSF